MLLMAFLLGKEYRPVATSAPAGYQPFNDGSPLEVKPDTPF